MLQHVRNCNLVALVLYAVCLVVQGVVDFGTIEGIVSIMRILIETLVTGAVTLFDLCSQFS